MTSGPQRLTQRGGGSARLLDSARIDKPSGASRARALELAATAGAFVATTAGSSAASGAASSSLSKSVAAWILAGAIGGGVVAFGIAAILGPTERAREPAPVLLEPEAPRGPPAPAVAAPGITPDGVPSLAAIREAIARKDFATARSLLDRWETQALSEADRLEAKKLRARATPALPAQP